MKKLTVLQKKLLAAGALVAASVSTANAAIPADVTAKKVAEKPTGAGGFPSTARKNEDGGRGHALGG